MDRLAVQGLVGGRHDFDVVLEVARSLVDDLGRVVERVGRPVGVGLAKGDLVDDVRDVDRGALAVDTHQHVVVGLGERKVKIARHLEEQTRAEGFDSIVRERLRAREAERARV